MVVCVNCVPYNAILNTGSTMSMMDGELCDELSRNDPFKYDISQCMGVHGACISNSIIACFFTLDEEGVHCLCTFSASVLLTYAPNWTPKSVTNITLYGSFSCTPSR